MSESGNFWAWAGVVGVAASWVAFLAGYFAMRKSPGTKESKRVRGSEWGMLLQTGAIFLVWLVRRPFGAPIVSVGGAGAEAVVVATTIAAVALAVVSAWLMVASIRALGKQFAIGPRVIEGHQLVVGGPYARVRNPIYSGLLGLMIASGLVVSVWWALGVGIVIFVTGTMIRVRIEEGLLRSVFGEDFEAYRKHVPALIPRMRTRG